MWLIKATLPDSSVYKLAHGDTVDTGSERYDEHILSVDPIAYGCDRPQGGMARLVLGGFTVDIDAFGGGLRPDKFTAELKVYTDGVNRAVFTATAHRVGHDEDQIVYTLWTPAVNSYFDEPTFLQGSFCAPPEVSDPEGGFLDYLWWHIQQDAGAVTLFGIDDYSSSPQASPVKVHVEPWDRLQDILDSLLLSRGCIADNVDGELQVVDLFSGYTVADGEIDLDAEDVEWTVERRAPVSDIEITGIWPCPTSTSVFAGIGDVIEDQEKTGEVNIRTTHQRNDYGTPIEINVYDVTQDRATYADNYQMLYERDIYLVTVPLEADTVYGIGEAVKMGSSLYGIVTRYEIESNTVTYTMLDGKRWLTGGEIEPVQTPTWRDDIAEITTVPTITAPGPGDFHDSYGTVVVEWDKIDEDILAVGCMAGYGAADTSMGFVCGDRIVELDGKQRVMFSEVALVKLPKFKGVVTDYYLGVELYYRRGMGFAQVRVTDTA